MEATYILTVEMDDASFAWLDGLRREYFPPGRNFLPAHLTLFHRLSAAQVDRLPFLETPRGAVELRFDRVALLRFGVAVHAQSTELKRLRDQVRTAVGGEFSLQDSQPWKPHVTVQNKVSADRARELHRLLEEQFCERTGAATALLIWQYLGGPWKRAKRIALE